MLPGTGGSETYTAGHVRELRRRGIKSQVVTIGVKASDYSRDFGNIPFLRLDKPEKIANLEGIIVFVNNYYPAKFKDPAKKPVMIVHNVLPNHLQKAAYHNVDSKKVTVLATSAYSAQQWAIYLKMPSSSIHVVHPFADPLFGTVQRSQPSSKHRILFAGRLYPEKGIYTLLESLHQQAILQTDNSWSVRIVAAGTHVGAGKTLATMIKDFPYATLIPARNTVSSMAKLLSGTDILLMPSVYAEPFGMLSVEAQHAGCRVVATNVGNLAGTNCGLLTLIKPHDPDAIARGIEQAIALGRSTPKERSSAKRFFTLKDSVDALMKILKL